MRFPLLFFLHLSCTCPGHEWNSLLLMKYVVRSTKFLNILFFFQKIHVNSWRETFSEEVQNKARDTCDPKSHGIYILFFFQFTQ